MVKESKYRRDIRKKPTMTLKERRALKHQKKLHREEHSVEGIQDGSL